MATDTDDGTPGTDFERRLRALLLESFAAGEGIEGRWPITIPIADAPNWTVTVRRSDRDGSSPYEPELLEE